jgi:hypothetical protein
MTGKTPSTSEHFPDVPLEVSTPVTLDEVRDSSNNLIDDNGITYDKTLTFKGTSEVNTDLRLRDGEIRLTEMTSNASGIWEKNFTLSDFRRYTIFAQEKFPPQNSSRRKIFVLATETPIINSVAGKDGAIEEGGTYDGDWAEITGNAPPNVEVEAFNGDTTTGKKALVNADGLFQLRLDELKTGQYNIKIKAPNNKESTVFRFTVAGDMPLSLDDVLDDDGNSVEEGDTTAQTTLTIKGKARNNGELTLFGGQPASVTVTAGDSGFWEHTFSDLPAALYSLTARTNYTPVETTAPRTFTVDSTIKPHSTRIYDTNGLIEDNGSTTQNYVYVRGVAAPLETIKLKINGVIVEKAEPANDKGDWVKLVTGLIPGTRYAMSAVAQYGDNAESNTWTITVAPTKNSTER